MYIEILPKTGPEWRNSKRKKYSGRVFNFMAKYFFIYSIWPEYQLKIGFIVGILATFWSRLCFFIKQMWFSWLPAVKIKVLTIFFLNRSAWPVLHDMRGTICSIEGMTHSKFPIINYTLFSFLSVLRGRLIKIKKYFGLKFKTEPENILNFLIKSKIDTFYDIRNVHFRKFEKCQFLTFSNYFFS